MNRIPLCSPKLIFWLIVTLALSLRLLYFSQTVQFIQPASGSDGYFYLEWAKQIVRGNILGRDVFYALPVYPYFLSLAYLFSGGETFGLILIQILLGSVNCGLIYILGRKLFNQPAGIMAALLACAYSMFIFYDRMLLPASLAIFLGLLLMLLLLRAQSNPGPKVWFTAGIFLGVCVLASASFTLLAIFLLFWIGWEYRKKSLQAAIVYGCLFFLGLALIIGGTTLRNYLAGKDAVLVTAHSGINFYIGNNPQANGLFKVPPYMRPTQAGLIEDAGIIAEKISGQRLKPSESSRFWFSRAISFIRLKPFSCLSLLGKKFLLFFNAKEYCDEVEYYIFNQQAKLAQLPLANFGLVLPWAILGMFLAWPQRKKINLLYYFVFSLAVGAISFFINSRYRLISVPFFLIFASAAIWQIWRNCRNRRYLYVSLLLGATLVLYFLTSIKLTANSSQPNSTFYYNKGVYLSDKKDYLQAKQQFQAALRINPLDFMSYLGLGNIYYEQQNFPQAEAYYKMSLAANPYFCDAYFNLAITYDETGEKEEAEKYFLQVLQLKPNDAASHYNLGRIYQGRGLNQLALQEYQQALKAKPGHWEILKGIEELELN